MADRTTRLPPNSGTSRPTAQPPPPRPSQPDSAQSQAPSPGNPHTSASAADEEELYDRAVAQAESEDPQHRIRGDLVLILPNLKLTCSSPYLEIGWSPEFRLEGVTQPWIQRIYIRKEKPPADRYAEDVGDHVWFGHGYGPQERRD